MKKYLLILLLLPLTTFGGTFTPTVFSNLTDEITFSTLTDTEAWVLYHPNVLDGSDLADLSQDDSSPITWENLWNNKTGQNPETQGTYYAILTNYNGNYCFNETVSECQSNIDYLGTTLTLTFDISSPLYGAENVQNNFSASVFSIGDILTDQLGKGLLILGSLIGLGFLLHFTFGSMGETGTSSRLGMHWSWYDKMTYKPYKGYKRWRSKKWNMNNTANL